MRERIIVAGGNQGALYFAELAARAGFEVRVFEAKRKEDVAYDWTDDVEAGGFAAAGLPEPPAGIMFRKRDWTLISPGGTAKRVGIPERDREMSVWRRPLNDWLAARAEAAGAEIFYGTPVKGVLAENGAVCGVELVSGKKERAEFVADCCGLRSPLRKNLPPGFGIPAEVGRDEAFFVRRTFFARPEGVPDPEHTNKVYLKHLGENGISWCILTEKRDAADVLVGRLSEMDDETYQRGLAALKGENPIIGDRVLRGGELLEIPVRRPLSRFAAPGYALLGDSACMTVPMLGSGIACSLKAAEILAGVLREPEGPRFSMSNLYKYQRDYMKEFGECAAVDLMKRRLLAMRPGDIDFVFGKGVVNDAMTRDCVAGRAPRPGVLDLLSAGIRGASRPRLLLTLSSMLLSMTAATRRASRMPAVYDERKFSAWERRCERPFAAKGEGTQKR